MKLPKDFITELEGYNYPMFKGLFGALSDTQPSVSIRYNIAKNNSVIEHDKQVKWCKQGRYLSNRVPFTFDPSMHQGLYYVQDASSMFISHIIKQLTKEIHTPISYLDACAAPGGKTTTAIDSLPKDSLVVANEYVPARAMVLTENLIKWGYPSIVVSKGDTSRFRKLKGLFDIIAADVPCSGEGMFRKEAEAVSQWSLSLVKECANRQKEILDNLWGALKPGGYLIYSTCTFNKHENESIIDYLIEEYDTEPIKIDLPTESGIALGVDGHDMCYRFMPHMVEGEGLFIAVVRKPGEDSSDSKRSKSKRKGQAKANLTNSKTKDWIVEGDNVIIEEGNQVIALPKLWEDEISQLKKCLDVIHYGLPIAIVKGKDVIPTQALALSTQININEFKVVDVDYKTAISYLRREAVIIDDAPRGYVLLTYNNTPLGFVKNLGNRANNLYPQEWRILSSHIPDEIPSILS